MVPSRKDTLWETGCYGLHRDPQQPFFKWKLKGVLVCCTIDLPSKCSLRCRLHSSRMHTSLPNLEQASGWRSLTNQQWNLSGLWPVSEVAAMASHRHHSATMVVKFQYLPSAWIPNREMYQHTSLCLLVAFSEGHQKRQEKVQRLQEQPLIKWGLRGDWWCWTQKF